MIRTAHYLIAAAIAVPAFVAGATLAPQQRQPPQRQPARAPTPATSDTGPQAEGNAHGTQYDEDAQPTKLPALPPGVSLGMIRDGDSVFHGNGGCFTCHGPEAQGMPNAGSSLTTGVNFIPDEWKSIDSLVTAGIPEALTRSSIAMPPRGAQSNLSADDVKKVAAYVWAISHTRDEPWPGGHRSHTPQVAQNP